MAELIVRPALNDHVALADVMAPSHTRWRNAPPVARVVVDAHVAAQRRQFASLAAESGVPFLVDPVTPLLQSEVDPDDKWAHLPFAQAHALKAADLRDRGRVRDLAIEVAECQLELGATIVVPAYTYAASPEDPWFEINLQLLRDTADYLDMTRPGLDLMPVFCAQLQSFGTEPSWKEGLDRFTGTVGASGARSVALCLSPAGAPGDSYGKITRLMTTAIHAKRSGLTVLAWRQGVYGPALVAAGLDGYETGMGTGERTDISGQQSRRRPKDPDRPKGGGATTGIYIETLGRSVPRRVGQVLLGDVAMRPKVMCDAETCCPTVAATLDQSRQHAVRARARFLGKLDEQPHARWRLNQVAREARQGVTLAKQATRVLRTAGIQQKIDHRNLEGLARAAEELGQRRSGAA